MNIAILDDVHGIFARMPCHARLAGHHVDTVNEHIEDVAALAERVKDAEVLGLHRERTKIPAALIERLPKLRMISVLGAIPHIDVAACTRHGVLVCDRKADKEPDPSTMELALALMLM